MRRVAPLTRWLAAFGVLIGCALVLTSASDVPFTVHQKAYYLDPVAVDFVRPGLVLKITAAEIASDGTIKARFRLTDPRGLPLDREGITTPGTVSVSMVAATIPQGQTQYRAYTTRVQGPSPVTKVTAVQAGTDANGVYQKLAEGEYQYTFNTKAPAGFDRTATHSIGAYSSRNLTEFDLGTQRSNDVYNFVPDGSPVTTVRDVVRTTTCNRCHDPLALHGGARQKVELCILCHQPQTVDPDTGNTVNFAVMIHKIHRGADLPSVKAGTPYRIIGVRETVFDFSDVEFPADVRNCQVCHDPNSGAAQADAWLKPNRAACGACHDNVNFATGQNHVDLPQVSDNQCAGCHIPQGELEFDASIRGAHTIERFSRGLPGTVFEILRVDDGSAGKRPTVTFTIKDKTGRPIPIAETERLALVLAGPSSDYTGTVSEDPRTAQGTTGGQYTWTFQNPIPADAKGTFSVGIEGYRMVKLMEGTRKERMARDAGENKVVYFSVDGSRNEARRAVVSVDKCNACHFNLSIHSDRRNRIEHCAQCHNGNLTDAAGRPAAQMPAQALAFKTLIHRLHTGADLGFQYTLFGGSGSLHDFSGLRFPGDRRNCDKCHINNSQQLPLRDNLLPVVNPRGPLDPMGPEAAACLGCHASRAAAAHAYSMTTPIGEACAACHGVNAEFSVNRAHAR